MIYIYPTDTAYALGCDGRDGQAIKKIFEIKGRQESKTLPLIAADIEMVRDWCELSEKAEELAEKYWPGPLTLVVPIKKQGLSKSVMQDNQTAIRVPNSEEARNLSKHIGAPICSTSANKSGNENCYSIDEVRASLGDGIKLVDEIIDKGALEKKEASTIVKIEGSKAVVLRKGAIIV